MPKHVTESKLQNYYHENYHHSSLIVVTFTFILVLYPLFKHHVITFKSCYNDPSDLYKIRFKLSYCVNKGLKILNFMSGAMEN